MNNLKKEIKRNKYFASHKEIFSIKAASAYRALLLVPHKQDEKPLIFKKKQKDVKVIPLKVKTSDTGRIRHFTPAAQE